MKKISPKKVPKGLGVARRRSVASQPADLVRLEPLEEGRAIPVVVRPNTDGVDLGEWAASCRDWVDRQLLEHRAVLFRGFPVTAVADFERLVMAVSDGQRLEYRDRTTPRTSEGERIYTATVHPPDQRIHLHNEGTYWIRWAQRLFFCCLTAPRRGGETPLADVRRVYDRIDPAVRDRFADKGVMLVRNFNDGFGLRWQEVFQTDDRSEVEQYCRDNDIDVEWKDGDRLRTCQVRPAARVHPVTGEPVWFNHAAFYHYTTLEPSVRAAMLAEFGEEGLPYNTCYGDGTPIDAPTAEHLRAAYDAEKTMFPWQDGDVMLLDNMTIAHAREPFEGDRLVLVAMTDAIEGKDCNQ